MADGAARGDDVARRGESRGGRRRLKRGGAAEQRQDDHQRRGSAGDGRIGPERALTGMAGAEIASRRRAGDDGQGRDRPVEARGEGQRQMARQHEEHQSQREIVIMAQPQAQDGLVVGGRLFRLPRRRDHAPLRRRDVMGDIGDDHRADDGAGLQKRAAPGKDLREQDAAAADERERGRIEQRGAPRQRRFRQRVIGEPDQDDRREACADRLPARCVPARRVDQVDVGLDIIKRRHQQEAAGPGHIGLPAEQRRGF